MKSIVFAGLTLMFSFTLISQEKNFFEPHNPSYHSVGKIELERIYKPQAKFVFKQLCDNQKDSVIFNGQIFYQNCVFKEFKCSVSYLVKDTTLFMQTYSFNRKNAANSFIDDNFPNYEGELFTSNFSRFLKRNYMNIIICTKNEVNYTIQLFKNNRRYIIVVT